MRTSEMLAGEASLHQPRALGFGEVIGPDWSEIDFEKLSLEQLEAIERGELPAELSPTGRVMRFSLGPVLPDLEKLNAEELRYVARTGYLPPGCSLEELR